MLDLLLTEDLFDHLTKHFGDHVPADQIEKAAADPRNAMKLVYGIYKGVIGSVDEPGALEKVAGLKPKSPEKEAKQERKSESEIQFDQMKAKARELSPKHWQWIMQVWSDNPDAQIDQSIFDFLGANDVSADDLKDKSLEEIERASQNWHEQEFANQKVGGTYQLGPEDEGSVRIGDYYWVPVYEHDARLEGSKMQNCIGRYCNPSNTTKIYSLRNKFNNPHVSMSVNNEPHEKGWVIQEIKGKQNKPPVEKYIQYVLPMVRKLIATGAKIGRYGDFWRMVPRKDIEEFLPHATDLLQTMRQLKLSPQELSVGMANQLTEKFATKWDKDDDTFDALMKRATPDTVSKSIREVGANVQFVLSAIKNRKISEEDADSFLASSNLRRSGRLLLMAAYHPEDFTLQLEAADPEDIIGAWENYSDAIEAFNGTHPVFNDLMRAAMMLMQHGSASYYLQQTLQNVSSLLASKVPAESLVELLRGSDGKVVVPEVLKPSVLAHKGLPVQIQLAATDDIDAETTRDWLYSLTPDELRQVTQYTAGVHRSVTTMARNLLEFLGEIEYGAEEIGVEDYAALAEQYDEPEELQQLYDRIPRKGPGPLLRLRRYIERKIRRLERLERAAEAADV